MSVDLLAQKLSFCIAVTVATVVFLISFMLLICAIWLALVLVTVIVFQVTAYPFIGVIAGLVGMAVFGWLAVQR